MKNKEKIQLLEHRLNIHSELLDRIISKLEFDDEPQLKKLDLSVFNGLDSKWKHAAVDGSTSRAYVFEHKPHLAHGEDYWGIYAGLQRFIGEDFDASNWKESLIERETNELTGSDLARAMLKRGDKIVTCAVSDTSDDNALNRKLYDAITLYKDDCTSPFESSGDIYEFAVPVNSQGEPLTSSDVGL